MLYFGTTPFPQLALELGGSVKLYDEEDLAGRANVWLSALCEAFWDGYGFAGADVVCARGELLPPSVRSLLSEVGISAEFDFVRIPADRLSDPQAVLSLVGDRSEVPGISCVVVSADCESVTWMARSLLSARQVLVQAGVQCPAIELTVAGGFRALPADPEPFDANQVAACLASAVRDFGGDAPHVVVRTDAPVGPAGVILVRVCSVDGSKLILDAEMLDLRGPALLANRPQRGEMKSWSVEGLTQLLRLPADVSTGDLLAFPASGWVHVPVPCAGVAAGAVIRYDGVLH